MGRGQSSGVDFSPFVEFGGSNMGYRLVQKSPLPAEPSYWFLSLFPAYQVRSCYVVEDDLEFVILLFLRCWDYRYAQPLPLYVLAAN